MLYLVFIGLFPGCACAASTPKESDRDAGDHRDSASATESDHAQPTDGEIVESELFVPEELMVADIEREDPGVRERLANTEIRRITYMSDGLRVNGYLLEPAQGEGYPALIYNHGGSREYGVITDVLAVSWLSRFSSWGYVVAASQYRGNAGGEGQEEYGGADIHDVLNLLTLLEERTPKVDATRIGMYGHSRGGMMTYLSLRYTDRIVGAVVDAGVADFFAWLEERPDMEPIFEMLIPDYTNNKGAALTDRSAVRWPEAISESTPLFLIHGDADDRVSHTQTETMERLLVDLGREVELFILPGVGHMFTENPDERAALIERFFNDHVRDSE